MPNRYKNKYPKPRYSAEEKGHKHPDRSQPHESETIRQLWDPRMHHTLLQNRDSFEPESQHENACPSRSTVHPRILTQPLVGPHGCPSARAARRPRDLARRPRSNAPEAQTSFPQGRDGLRSSPQQGHHTFLQGRDQELEDSQEQKPAQVTPAPAASTLQTPRDHEMASRQTRYDDLSKEERRKQDEWAQEQLILIGTCRAGFAWYRIDGGYRCHGGGHIVNDELLAEGRGYQRSRYPLSMNHTRTLGLGPPNLQIRTSGMGIGMPPAGAASGGLYMPFANAMGGWSPRSLQVGMPGSGVAIRPGHRPEGGNMHKGGRQCR